MATEPYAPGRPTVILQSVAKIIRDMLRLQEAQVVLARQKFDIPTTGALLVVLSMEDTKPIGNNSRVVDSGIQAPNGMRDEQYMTVRDLLQIDIMAMTDIKNGSNKARDLRNQVIMALMSTRSEQMQEALAFSLARIPVGFVNTSSVETTEYLERYTATIAVTYAEEAQNFPEYFTDFNAEFIENNDENFTDAAPSDAFATGG